jgi:uracil phosphoribosyltransferase
MNNVTVVEHPLVRHKLTLMRDKNLPTRDFRALASEVGMLLGYEAMRDLPLEEIAIETPLEPMQAQRLAGKKPVLAPILRAGIGFLDGLLALLPSARVAHIGLYRDPETLEPVEYYFKSPGGLDERLVLVLDPMLATGGTAVAAIDLLKRKGAKNLRFICLLAAPEGVSRLRDAHPDVPIWTAAVDDRLDDHAYIRPGLGDAGDRIFGTR